MIYVLVDGSVVAAKATGVFNAEAAQEVARHVNPEAGTTELRLCLAEVEHVTADAIGTILNATSGLVDVYVRRNANVEELFGLVGGQDTLNRLWEEFSPRMKEEFAALVLAAA